MIRIDEIYDNTFWPWFAKNRIGTRVFFCDPPGHTGPEHLFNLGRDDIIENDYVFFHDQEPIHLDTFESLFNEVIIRNWDFFSQQHTIHNNNNFNWPNEKIKNDFHQYVIQPDKNPVEFFCSCLEDFYKWRHANSEYFKIGHIVVSERGEFVDRLEQEYGWKSHYYFYHGWACMDWFRGYDRTFLIPRAEFRDPTQTFMSPNRIIAGKRDHRVLFLYNIFKNNLEHNHISAPRICTYENVDISTVARKYCNIYPDIEQVFDRARLPRLFTGEETQQMTSCWLSNFTEAQDSLVYVPTETVYFGRRTHLTEKTFKAIALEMPFVLVAPSGSLEYLREYGFKTFSGIFDESYDEEIDDHLRLEKVVQLLKQLDNLSTKERQQLHRACLPVVQHNFEHFYGQGFSQILWKELIGMLDEFRV